MRNFNFLRQAVISMIYFYLIMMMKNYKYFILLSGCFDSFAYDNNFAYLKIGNTYYVVDIANEVKNEYSDDEFSEMYPDYENSNWYDA